MSTGHKYVMRYSKAFKLKVIEDIEKHGLTQSAAAKKYGLKARSLIHKWLKQYGKNHLLHRIVRVQMPTEKNTHDIIKELKKEKQKLESALAQSQLKVLALESLVEVAKEDFNIDIKKKVGTKQLLKQGEKIQRQK